ASREDAGGDRQNTAEDHAMADSTHSEGPQQGGGGPDSEKGTDEELSFAFADFAEDIAAELDPLAGGLVPANDPPQLVNSEGMAEAFGQFHPEEVARESHVGSDHFGGFVVAASEGELDSVFVSGGEPELPSSRRRPSSSSSPRIRIWGYL
ncbi:MAG: hypothetical protein WCL50_03225, partial [Spirochaetota bacterium]